MEIKRGQLLSRTEISDALVDAFGIKLGERMVRYALDAFGIKGERVPRKGEPGGPVTRFDPFTVWTVASVHHRSRQTFKSGHDALAPYRELARQLAHLPEAQDVPEFTQNEDFAAQVLLVGSPDMGMDPVHRREHLQEHHWLIRCCSQGELFMNQALKSWEAAYMDLLRVMDPENPPMSKERRREIAAEAFVRDFGAEWHAAEGRRPHDAQ